MLLTCLIVFLFGSAVGSFLNVVIDRGPQGRTALKGRSSCDFCRVSLKAWELIPVLGFFLVGRKCRSCGHKLSWQYPLIETLTGLLFVGAFFILSRGVPFVFLAPSFWPAYFYWVVLLSGLLAIVVSDLKYGLIPDKVSLPLIIISLCYLLFVSPTRLWPAVYTGFGAASFFAFLILITKGKGMGWGDVKLVFLLGLVGGWPQALVGLLLSFLTGSVVGTMLIVLGKKRLHQTIPFGPFLVVGSILGLFFGQAIFNWYLGYL